METDRIVWDAKTAFFENLKYEFRYNESENTIEGAVGPQTQPPLSDVFTPRGKNVARRITIFYT